MEIERWMLDFFGVFVHFLVKDRGNDKRLWEYAIQVQTTLESPENKDKSKTEKADLALGMLKDYASALGIDLKDAIGDAILAITRPIAQVKAGTVQ